VCESGDQGATVIGLELGLDLDPCSLSSHPWKVEMGICSKACIVPPTYLDYLISKTPSLNFHGHIITTRNHDFHDTFSPLSAASYPEPTCTGGRGLGREQNASEGNVSVLKILCE